MPYKDKTKKAEFQKQYMKKYRQMIGYKERKKIYNDRERKQEWYEKRRYSKKQRVRQRKTRLRATMKSHGLTIDDWNRMFQEQNGKCAICGEHQSEIKQRFCVDHCHKKGIVRGLLCHKCNRGIGFLRDDIENLRCAILYLNKYA